MSYEEKLVTRKEIYIGSFEKNKEGKQAFEKSRHTMERRNERNINKDT